MRWSYAELLETPEPVVDEVVAWMHEEAQRATKREREQEKAAEQAKSRRRR